MLNSIVSILDSGVAASTTAYESIATTTVGGAGSSTITFSSIPATYAHLQLRATFFAASGANLITRFNSDTAANYAAHDLYGSGAAAAASATTSTANPYSGYTAGSTNPGVMITDILNYSNTTTYKTSRTLTGSDANGSGYIFMRSQLWMNTAAINTLTVTISGGANFTQYSSFALYGIKGA